MPLDEYQKLELVRCFLHDGRCKLCKISLSCPDINLDDRLHHLLWKHPIELLAEMNKSGTYLPT